VHREVNPIADGCQYARRSGADIGAFRRSGTCGKERARVKLVEYALTEGGGWRTGRVRTDRARLTTQR
jgi:hypothetical protein